MKRTLSFLFLFFITFTAAGQVYQAMPQAGYGPIKRMRVDSVMTIPSNIGPLRNIQGGKDTGQVRYNISDSSIYVYTGTNWVKSVGGTSSPDTIVAKYPIRIDTSGVRDTIYLAQSFIDSVYNSSPGFGTGLVSASVAQTDTVVTITPPIVWKRNSVTNTQNVGQPFPITRASPNYYRTDIIYITAADTLGYVQGTESLSNPPAPIIPNDGILITYVNVYDSTVLPSSPPSTYQRTAVVYVDANNGQLATDSLSFSWNQTDKSLTVDSLNSRKDILVTTLRIGRGNNTVAGNISIGQNSLSLNTTGGNNTSIGDGNLSNNTTGSRNVAIGYNTLVSNVIGTDITAIGPNALTVNTGSFNTAIGSGALFRNTTGTRNAALGYWTLLNNTTGSENTAFGVTSMRANKTGIRNVAIGRETLWTDSFTSNNTVIGYRAGYANNKDSCVFIGSEAGYNNTRKNALYIANTGTATPLIYGEFDSAQLTINGRLNITGPLSNATAAADSALIISTAGEVKKAAIGGGGGGGTVTSVGLTTGTSGTDINIGAGTSPVTTSGTITLNVPSASATARGVVTTGTQTFAGSKTFNSNITVNSATVGTNAQNTIIGQSSLSSLSSGNYNTTLGFTSGLFLTNGTYNTLIGAQAGLNRISGDYNVSIGYNSNSGLTMSNTGNANTVVGSKAIVNLISGSNNTILGYNILDVCSSGSNNTIVGATVLPTTATLNSNVILADGQGNIRFRNDATNTYLNENVCISTTGTSTPATTAALDITSTTKGFLPPRMTGAQAELISSPAEGLMVYSTDGSGTTITSKGWWGFDGTTWVKLN